MTSRRGFLSSILGLAAAPAIVSASSLMKLVPLDSGVLVYKATGRYDLKERAILELDSKGLLELRPSKILVPATLIAECERILNQEFDKAYLQTRRWA